MLHSTILANKGSGTLVDFMDSERSITDIASVVMQKQITLPQSVQQYSFLEIAIRAVNCDEHTSLYDTYDIDYARTVLRCIRIDRLFVDGAEERLSFDMQDKSDLNALYHNYLSLHRAGSFSSGGMSDYHQYDQIDTLTNRLDYQTATTNQKVIIDLRPSRGFTEAPDRPQPNNRPTLDFLPATTNVRNYRVIMRCVYPASFRQIQTESLVKPIVYYPTESG